MGVFVCVGGGVKPKYVQEAVLLRRNLLLSLASNETEVPTEVMRVRFVLIPMQIAHKRIVVSSLCALCFWEDGVES